MNCLLLLPEEYAAPWAHVRGERAVYLREYHDLKLGLELNAAVLNQGCGKARVDKLSEQEVVLEVTLTRPAPPRIDCNLLIATPRPQTIKKIVQLAAMCGLSSLTFFRADATQKSYLDSKSLRPDALLLETIKGLEQAADCVAPIIEICSDLNEALVQVQLKHPKAVKIVADSRGESISTNGLTLAKQESLLALGPEGGWSARELATFKQLEFCCISLGPRLLRLEVAAAVLLGHLGGFR